jgi:hypothetical protein
MIPLAIPVGVSDDVGGEHEAGDREMVLGVW